MKSFRLILFGFFCCFCLITCSKDGSVNIFSVEDDVMLGMELRDQVLDSFPVLPESQYPQSYNYIREMVKEILSSDDINYPEQFAWETYIIDDTLKNAFAAPGGYIFVYTGLIKFLESPNALAGVLAHEVAHADRRHSTDQLTKTYGLAVLLNIVLGTDPGLITQILGTLLTLEFSRDAEEEADEYSVIYLCDTKYAADGAAAFFEKLERGGAASPPEFLSTHPNPGNRVMDIHAIAEEKGCDTTGVTELSRWNSFVNSLP